MTFLLCVACLIIFLTQQNKTEDKIANIDVVSDAYDKQEAFGYYLISVAKASAREVFTSDNLAKEDNALKDLFLKKFKSNYLTSAKLPLEYDDQEYKNYLRNESNYELSIDKTTRTLILKLKAFEFSYKPGLATNQEVGLIKVKKDIILKVSF